MLKFRTRIITDLNIYLDSIHIYNDIIWFYADRENRWRIVNIIINRIKVGL